MKLKKFFAGVLAAAMMLTVGATAAFAEETGKKTGDAENSFPGTTINATSDLVLTKTYKVESGKAPFEEFEFDVTYVGAVKKDTNITTEPTNLNLPKKAEFTRDGLNLGEDVTGLVAKTYTNTFKINMSELQIPTGGTGIYVYKITEKNNGTPAVSYNTDGGCLYLIVTVSHVTGENNVIQEGQYNYAVALRRGEDNLTAANAAKGTKVLATEAFHNTYGAGDNAPKSVELEKVVHGNFGDLGKDFTFSVTFNKAAGGQGANAEKYAPIAFTVENQNRKVYEVAADGSVTTTAVTELGYGKTYNVTLKHGETISFSNLPAGVTYTMIENNKDSDGKVDGVYTVTGEKSSNTTNKVEDAAKVTIENTNEGQPDMGVVLDNAPYIAMLAIVAIGGVALMLNKRRRDEE